MSTKSQQSPVPENVEIWKKPNPEIDFEIRPDLEEIEERERKLKEEREKKFREEQEERQRQKQKKP